MKIIAQSKLHMQPKQQWYRKLRGTLEKHNWSSRPPTNMNHNFFKILWSYLQLYYYHLKMILQLTRSNNTKKASLSIYFDRICHSTLQAHNWRFRPPKGVIFNNLESSWKALHLFYYLQDMIQSLVRLNKAIIQICTESLQNLTMNL